MLESSGTGGLRPGVALPVQEPAAPEMVMVDAAELAELRREVTILRAAVLHLQASDAPLPRALRPAIGRALLAFGGHGHSRTVRCAGRAGDDQAAGARLPK